MVSETAIERITYNPIQSNSSDDKHTYMRREAGIEQANLHLRITTDSSMDGWDLRILLRYEIDDIVEETSTPIPIPFQAPPDQVFVQTAAALDLS